MRVLHVITGLAAGGAEQQLRLLLGHLDVESEVVTLTNPGLIAEAIRADGTPVHHLGMRGNRDLAALPRLVRLIRAGGYDLVHTHLYRACLYGRVAARLAGTPAVVATEHSLGDTAIEGRPRTRGVRALYLAGERLGDATVAVSETVAARLRQWGVSSSRIVVVPNALEAPAFDFDPAARRQVRARRGIAEQRFVVGGVGRLEPGKRFAVLLQAVREVEDVTVLLVGDGSERARLQQLAADLGIADRVIFAGESGEVAAELSAMDVLASPSGDETFGLAVLEALAAGLPVCYVRCPALEDLPRHAAPTAVRIAPDVTSLRDHLAAARDTGQCRHPPPPAVTHYDITRLAGQVRSLYHRLHDAATGLRHGTEDTDG